MKKIYKLPYYGKLFDLFDAYNPSDFPSKIQEIVGIINKALIAYERKNPHLNEAWSGLKILVELKSVFENSLTSENRWGFYVYNSKQNIQVNLRPFFSFLSEKPYLIGELEQLQYICMTKLLTSENADEFKKVIKILSILKGTFDNHYCKVW